MYKNYKFDVITEASVPWAKVQVVTFPLLRGSDDVNTAEHLYFANEAGMKLKMVKIELKDSSLRVEPGALYHMCGDLEMVTSTGGGVFKGLARKMTSGESFFVNEIKGTGTIYLEPTFGHFLLHDIKKDAKGVICDKGMFFAGTSGLDIGAAIQKNISAGLFGGEGLFQTKVTGEGIAILFSPVPVEEIQEVELKNEKLSVDGNFALMRTDGVSFKAEKSSKSWLATSVSGEGLLQTFQGEGTVWIAPTQVVYERMAYGDLNALSGAPGSSNNKATGKKGKKNMRALMDLIGD